MKIKLTRANIKGMSVIIVLLYVAVFGYIVTHFKMQPAIHILLYVIEGVCLFLTLTALDKLTDSINSKRYRDSTM